MKIFEEMNSRGHEQLVWFNDSSSGLKGIVAIHNSVLGPSLGGCRMYPYKNEEEALIDVLRLSKGMTYKASIAGLNLGGGKAVIIGNPNTEKSENLFRSFGRFVEGLGGRYITAEDVGTTVKDMEYVRRETNYVTGISEFLGGSGDPSPVTAFGVFMGMQAAVKVALNKDDLGGLSISVQGAGKVGMRLIEYLYNAGAKIYVSDIDQNKTAYAVEKYEATEVENSEIHTLDVDIFSPNALGAVINDESIENLNCKIVAGGANNILKDELRHGELLMKKNILYAPDYAINAGGLINVSNELEGYNKERAFKQAEGIYDTLLSIFERSSEEGIPTNVASNRIAKDRISKISDLRSFYLPYKKIFKMRNS